MQNTFNNFGDNTQYQIVSNKGKIVNKAPLVIHMQALRDQVTDVVERGDVPPEAAAVLREAIAEAEREVSADIPRRSRLRQILASVTTASAGLAASAELADSVNAVLKTITGLE